MSDRIYPAAEQAIRRERASPGFEAIPPRVRAAIDSAATEGLPVEETVASEIDELRDRLGEIRHEREHLSEEDRSRRDELLEEENKLGNRLSELEDRLAEEDAGTAEKGAAAQTDLTRPPKLPDSRDQS
jgi:chromosome segregation ATPase